jgi:DNA polymerase III subunit delta
MNYGKYSFIYFGILNRNPFRFYKFASRKSNIMSAEAVLTDLKNKIYKPVYLLYGEESYFIDEITNYISKNVLTEAEKSFNQTVLYGKDSNVKDIIEICRRFPMMANYQVVIIKEAQDLKNFKEIDVYLSNPLKSTILVFNFKYTRKFDKRLKFFTLANKSGVVFESKTLYERQVNQWISNSLKQHKLTIHPEALRLMYESLGNDLSRISNSINKLKLAVKDNESQIDTETVAANIGVHRDFNIFELQKALGQRDAYKAFRIIDYFGKDPKNNPLVRNIVLLFDYFFKVIKYHGLTDRSKNNVAAELAISPYFADEYANAARAYSLTKLISIISYLRECDIKSKGVESPQVEEGDLMKELIYKIIH